MAATTSARAVSQYRDESLDGLVGQENGILLAASRRQAEIHRRRSMSGDNNVSSNLPPEAPEVPRAPPISYRTNGPENATPQRSFSQRAKARPFLREALVDDGSFEDNPAEYSRPPTAETYSRTQDMSRGGVQRQLNEPLRISTAVSDRRPPVDSATSAASPREPASTTRSSKVNDRRSRRLSENSQYAEEPMSADARSSGFQDMRKMPVDSQRREWAPDRSPLQKLEVTLNDISKEERRARVEEAEMLLRESKAGRGGRPTSRDITPTTKAPARLPSTKSRPANTEVSGLEEAGLFRSLSGTQRDRLHHSTTIESRKPDVQRLSGDGSRGFEYGEQQYSNTGQPRSSRNSGAFSNQRRSRDYAEDSQRDSLAGSRVPSVRKREIAESSHAAPEQCEPAPVQARSARPKRPAPEPRYMETSVPQSQGVDASSRFPQHNPVWQANAQTPAYTVPSNITRAVSMQQKRPAARFAEDRETPRSESVRKDANSSHRAALTDAAVVGAAAAAVEPVITRGGSRRLYKAPPSGYERNKERPEVDGSSLEATPTHSSVPGGSGSLSRTAPANAPSTGTAQLPNSQSNSSQRRPAPIGLGLRESPRTTNLDEKPLPDPHHPRTRQQSVSFKEPFDKPRPVDEWKQGGVARMSLADFVLDAPPAVAVEAPKDQAWWESSSPATRRRSRRRSAARDTETAANASAAIDDRHTEFKPPLYLKCGPLLRYAGMKRVVHEQPQEQPTDDLETCRYSIMIVTQDSRSSYETVPTLRLFARPKRLLPAPPQVIGDEDLAPEYVDPIAGAIKLSRTGKALYVRPVDHLEEEKDLSRIEDDNGLFEESPSPLDINGSREATAASSNKRTEDLDGEHVGKYQELRGVRLYADYNRDVTFWKFNLEIELGETQQHVAYRINHGAALGFWVPARGQSMNIMFHSCNGFSLSVTPDTFSGPDPLWRDVLNTAESSPFHVMLGGGDQVYMDRVVVDTHHFGDWTKLRNPQHKHHAPFTLEMREELETFYLERYSMWFSQGLFGMAVSQIPMVNMWDDHDIIDGFGSYPDHFMRSEVFSGLGGVAYKYYMLFQHQSVPEETTAEEPSWILGRKPGPYVGQVSKSLFMHLGKRIAFLGLDCRTERTRTEILSLDTYDIVLERCRKEIVEGETKHLILLLGVPIAYPRLVFLENLLTSRVMDPIKALGRAGFIKSGLLNKFDGGVEILDDLDDHWTAKNHKHERNDFVEDLQDLAAEKSVRITILGGDVHLGAIGQFYSNPKLRIPKDRDHRYMPNIISSAIVNTPPSNTVADILNKRNKVHHLNQYTDESMIPMFSHDVDGKKRNNTHLLPRRNWCSVKEYVPGSTPPQTPSENLSVSGSEAEGDQPQPPQRRFSFSKEDVNPRNLFRRISSRGAPPSSYRNTANYNTSNEQEELDPDYPVHGESGHHSQSALPNQVRHSFDSAQPSQRAASYEHVSSGAPVRPGMFHRRPTNLSEKAARKGNVPGVDHEGNEVEVNDYINLEGGLDVVLNIEVNQKDPAGITAPYRLLVPALWYDGSSDREKLDGAAGVQRKATLLKRFSMGGRRSEDSDGQRHESGNWGKDTAGDAGSYSGSEEDDEQVRGRGPRRLLGLLGSMRSRRQYEDGNMADHPPQRLGPSPADHRGEDRLYDSENHPSTYQTDSPSTRPARFVGGAKYQPSPGSQGVANTRQPYVISSQNPPQQSPSAPQQNDLQSFAHASTQSNEPGLPQQQMYDRDSYAESQQTRPVPQGQLSKQERVLGIQALGDVQPPEARPLRGDGIIGRDRGVEDEGSSGRSPMMAQSPGQGHGYNSVEAYRPSKPERRWSLRGVRNRARSGTRWDWE